MPSRKYELDQHFLKSPKFALMLIGHSNIRKNDTVIEIGAGSGVITTALSKKCKIVYALEPDRDTAAKLRKNLEHFGAKNVIVIEKGFQDFEFPEGNYKIFSNPPFRYTSEIFYKILNLENDDGKIIEKGAKNLPKSIFFIMQKNLALKLIPTDRHYTSQLGHILQKYYDVKIRLPLKKTDFTPPPAVDTVLISLVLRQDNNS